MKDDEIAKTTFRHKKNCNGVLYMGYLNNKKIVVCEQCHMLYNYDAHLWTCPICKHRFKSNEQQSTANNTQSQAQAQAMLDSGSKSHRDDSDKKVFRGRIPLRHAKTTLESKNEDIFHFYRQDSTGEGEEEDNDNDNTNHNKLNMQFRSSLRDRSRKLTSKSQTEGGDPTDSPNDNTFEHNERHHGHNSNSNHKQHIHNSSNNNSPLKTDNRLPPQQRKSELIGDFK